MQMLLAACGPSKSNGKEGSPLPNLCKASYLQYQEMLVHHSTFRDAANGSPAGLDWGFAHRAEGFGEKELGLDQGSTLSLRKLEKL